MEMKTLSTFLISQVHSAESGYLEEPTWRGEDMFPAYDKKTRFAKLVN